MILGVLPNDTYRIKSLNEFKDRGFESTAHVSQLKIWRGSRDNKIVENSESEMVLTQDNFRIFHYDTHYLL